MRRRRGEISLFEILRQPEPAPEAPPPAEEESPPKRAQKAPKGKKNAVAALLLGGAEAETRGDPVLGSTTPPPPEAAPRPRLDVTPPSRQAARRAASLAASQSASLSANPPSNPASNEGSLPSPRRLPELADELATPEEAGPKWWERDLTVRPVVIGIAAVGVLLSWLVFYQLGAGRAEEELARLDRFAGADAPAWDVPLLNGAPGRQPEVRNAEGPDGGPAERIPATVTSENALLPVIMVAQRIAKPESAESLMLHIEGYLEAGIAHVTPFKGEFAVFIGPFDGPEEAKEALKRVRGIPKYKTTDFKDAYVHQLEFTPEEQRLLGRE